MTRVAALYDIHGNLPALEAVLGELDADLVVVGGDVVWGPWPQETMDLLRSLPNVSFLMGNADRDVFDRVQDGWGHVNDWCADQLSADHLEFLRTRPPRIELDNALYCHGTPRSDTETLTTATPDERVEEVCAGVTHALVVCGHTHAQFDRTVGTRRIVNAGSVGNPFGDPGGHWAIVDGGVELRITRYDTDATAESILASGYPDKERFAKQVAKPAAAEVAAQLFT